MGYMGREAMKATKFMGKSSWKAGKFFGKKAFDIITDKKGKEKLAQEEAQRRAEEQKAYMYQIAPQHGQSNFQISQISIADADKYLLGLDGITFPYRRPYMFRDKNKVITLPESKYGYNRGYYLVHIDFRPDQFDVTNGAGYSHSEGHGNFNANGQFNMGGGGFSHTSTGYNPITDTNFYNTTNTFGGNGNMNMNGNMRNSSDSISRTRSTTEHRERYTYAIFTFIDVNDRSNIFKVRVNYVNNQVIDGYKQYFLLNEFELKQKGLI